MKDYAGRGTMDFLFDLFDIFNLFIEVLRNLGEYLTRN